MRSITLKMTATEFKLLSWLSSIFGPVGHSAAIRKVIMKAASEYGARESLIVRATTERAAVQVRKPHVAAKWVDTTRRRTRRREKRS